MYLKHVNLEAHYYTACLSCLISIFIVLKPRFLALPTRAQEDPLSHAYIYT